MHIERLAASFSSLAIIHWTPFNPGVHIHSLQNCLTSKSLALRAISSIKSSRSVFFHSYFLNYNLIASLNVSLPMLKNNCFSIDEPFPYVMLSNESSASSVVLLLLATACVEVSLSAPYAKFFLVLNPNQGVPKCSRHVHLSWATNAMKVANASLSHRSSHHTMVTKLPNHWCIISCSRVFYIRSYPDLTFTFDCWIYASLKVTRPTFSIAPMF